jgi:hypothetical protein
MRAADRVFRIAAVAAALFAMTAIARAQSGDPKAGDQQRAQQAGDSAKDAAKKADEFAEAAKTLGGAAANPECVWLGRRAVNLLWRDDLDTAFRHLDLYDRFGCPTGHLQMTFRCVIRLGSIDAKAPESLGQRVHACWMNPNQQAQAATQPATGSPSGAQPAQSSGSASQ